MSKLEVIDPSNNWRIKTWFPELEADTHSLLLRYFNFIIQNNKAYGLFTLKALSTADLTHFADSIISYKIVSKKLNNNEYLYDIGSGSGFPGIIYSILNPNLKIILIDSDERKCKFLNEVITFLGLTHVSVNCNKVELLPDDSITQAITRNFLPLPRALLNMRKVVKRGGVIYHLKSDEWSLEVSEIPSQLCSSWIPALESNYKVPTSDTKLYVIRTDKI